MKKQPQIERQQKLKAPITKEQALNEYGELIEDLLKTYSKEPISEPTTVTSTSNLSKLNKFIQKSSYWLPQEYREPFAGDLMELTAKMKLDGCSNRFIWITTIWHILVALKASLSSKLDTIVRKKEGKKQIDK